MKVICAGQAFDFEPLGPPKIENFGKAIQSLEGVQVFLDSKEYSDQATTIAAAVDLVASLHYKSLASARQSTLNEYFWLSKWIEMMLCM